MYNCKRRFAPRLSGPSWLNSDFEFVATYEPGATRSQFAQMMANVLVERFGLVFHVVSSEVNGFEMTVGKGAPGLPHLRRGLLKRIRRAPNAVSLTRKAFRSWCRANFGPPHPSTVLIV